MTSRPTRVLFDVLVFCANAWLWLAVYQSFTRSGVWRVIDQALGRPSELHAQTAVLGVCVLVGWLFLALVGWSLSRVLVTHRSAVLPIARARRISRSIGSQSR